MGIASQSPQIKALRLEVEKKLGKKLEVPADFVSLADILGKKLNQHISPSTLERVWNYSTRKTETISNHTINLLCNYIGKKDWEDFCKSLSIKGIKDSEIVNDKSIECRSLTVGDRVEIGWLPNRNCVIEYLGDYQFVAVACENSTLQPGDTFRCIELIKNQPAIMDDLIQAADPDKKPKRYIAGKHHGLSFIRKLSAPELNIVYFHGLSSSGESRTGKQLRALFHDLRIITPDIPIDPKDALSMLRKLVADLDYDKTVIIGTSMGGMYAQQMTGFKRILVNPAFHVSETLKKNSGRKLPFFSKRQDGAIEFEVTPELINSFEKMETCQFENASDPDNVTALFGNKDTTVNCKDEYLKHYQDFKDFDGEHRLTEENVEKIIVPLIKEKLNLFN